MAVGEEVRTIDFLLTHYQVDMPVFFFLDNDFVEDPLMKGIDSIVLSYTFFKAKYDKDGQLVPVKA